MDRASGGPVLSGGSVSEEYSGKSGGEMSESGKGAGSEGGESGKGRAAKEAKAAKETVDSPTPRG